MANPGFVTGLDRSWWRIRGLLPAGILNALIRWPELVANPGFVTGSDQSWWRIRGLLLVQAGVGGDFRIFRDRVADLAPGAAIIS